MLRLDTSCVVRPAERTPNCGICISDCDQDKPITHAPIIYFYRPSRCFSFASAIETLKSSLSQALVHFYPLAGRLHWTSGGRVELDCNSIGAQFYAAESEARIADFGDFSPTPELWQLIPSVNYSAPLHELPLLLVQVTRFSCGGFSLGLGISHIMVDAVSLLHFMSVWASLTRGEPLDTLPFLDRTALLAREPPAPPLFNHERFSPPPLLIGRSDEQEERKKETTIAMLHLSKTQVGKLKSMANVRRVAKIRAYTRYEAVAGHLWKCACKARAHKNEQTTKLRVQVNIRDRVIPQLPQGYFGNALLTIMATSQSGELITQPLVYASSRIREAIETVTDEYVKSALDFVKRQPDLSRFRTFHTVGSSQGAFYGNPNFEITSWMGLPIRGQDFGWGKEIYAGPGTLAFDGKCFIFDSNDGDGSVVIPIRLQVAHMEAFKKFFYEDIGDRYSRL